MRKWPRWSRARWRSSWSSPRTTLTTLPVWPSSSRSTHTMIGASYRTHLRMTVLRVRLAVVSAVSVSTVARARRDPVIFVCQGVAVRREWELDDLIASWTLVDADLELLVGKHDAPRLSGALMLKFF